jgi:hypothetical protein
VRSVPGLDGCNIVLGDFQNGWRELNLKFNVFQFSLVVAKDLSFFIIGGQEESTGGFMVTDRVIQYKMQDLNPAKLKEIEMEPMKVGRADACCAINTLTNEIYVIGGHRNEVDTQLCEKLDITRNKWTQMPILNEAKNSASCLIFDNAYLYVFGGESGTTTDVDLTY